MGLNGVMNRFSINQPLIHSASDMATNNIFDNMRTGRAMVGFNPARYDAYRSNNPIRDTLNPYALMLTNIDYAYTQAKLYAEEKDSLGTVQQALREYLCELGKQAPKPSKKERKVRERTTRGKLRYIWREDSQVPLNNIAIFAMTNCTDMVLTEVEISNLRFRLIQEIRNSGLDFEHGLPEHLREGDSDEQQAKRVVWLDRLHDFYASRHHLVIEDAISLVQSEEYVKFQLARRREHFYVRETGVKMRKGELPPGILKRTWGQWFRELFGGGTLYETPV